MVLHNIKDVDNQTVFMHIILKKRESTLIESHGKKYIARIPITKTCINK